MEGLCLTHRQRRGSSTTQQRWQMIAIFKFFHGLEKQTRHICKLITDADAAVWLLIADCYLKTCTLSNFSLAYGQSGCIGKGCKGAQSQFDLLLRTVPEYDPMHHHAERKWLQLHWISFLLTRLTHIPRFIDYSRKRLSVKHAAHTRRQQETRLAFDYTSSPCCASVPVLMLSQPLCAQAHLSQPCQSHRSVPCVGKIQSSHFSLAVLCKSNVPLRNTDGLVRVCP